MPDKLRTFWESNIGVYLLGFVLLATGMVWTATIGGSSDPHARVSWAVFGGICGTLACAFPSWIAQYLFLKYAPIARPSSFAKRFVIGIVPIALLLSLLAYEQWSRTTPAARFKYMVWAELPSSVSNLEQGGLKTFNSFFLVLTFDVDESDLNKLLNDGKYTEVDERSDYERYEKRIERDAGFDIELSEDHRTFLLKEKDEDGDSRVQKRIFHKLGESRAIFELEDI